jgi:hypothetical protein
VTCGRSCGRTSGRQRGSPPRGGTGGGAPALGRPASNCPASRSRPTSSPKRPSTWSPMGRPSASEPKGIDIAGFPVTFANSPSKVRSSAALRAPAIGSSAVPVRVPRGGGGPPRVGVTHASYRAKNSSALRATRWSAALAHLSSAALIRCPSSQQARVCGSMSSHRGRRPRRRAHRSIVRAVVARYVVHSAGRYSGSSRALGRDSSTTCPSRSSSVAASRTAARYAPCGTRPDRGVSPMAMRRRPGFVRTAAAKRQVTLPATASRRAAESRTESVTACSDQEPVTESPCCGPGGSRALDGFIPNTPHHAAG